jgi:uncharacterized protein YlxW (UPF0749 family)
LRVLKSSNFSIFWSLEGAFSEETEETEETEELEETEVVEEREEREETEEAETEETEGRETLETEETVERKDTEEAEEVTEGRGGTEIELSGIEVGEVTEVVLEEEAGTDAGKLEAVDKFDVGAGWC